VGVGGLPDIMLLRCPPAARGYGPGAAQKTSARRVDALGDRTTRRSRNK